MIATTPRARGRPPKGAARMTERIELRLSAGQRDKLAALGGADWLRARIDRARITAPTRPPR